MSAASLLQAEYPDNLAHTDRWSYPRLSEALRRIGAPAQDCIELFGRMVFNAMSGNDDDHVRNHAVVYRHGWRLSPAFDVVPNPVETPDALTMQLSLGRFDISRDAILGDAHRFAFSGREEAERYLDSLLKRIANGFALSQHLLPAAWQEVMQQRLAFNLARLGRPAAERD